jgi:hypothetical protein
MFSGAKASGGLRTVVPEKGTAPDRRRGTSVVEKVEGDECCVSAERAELHQRCIRLSTELGSFRNVD